MILIYVVFLLLLLLLLVSVILIIIIIMPLVRILLLFLLISCTDVSILLHIHFILSYAICKAAFHAQMAQLEGSLACDNCTCSCIHHAWIRCQGFKALPFDYQILPNRCIYCLAFKRTTACSISSWPISSYWDRTPGKKNKLLYLFTFSQGFHSPNFLKVQPFSSISIKSIQIYETLWDSPKPCIADSHAACQTSPEEPPASGTNRLHTRFDAGRALKIQQI